MEKQSITRDMMNNDTFELKVCSSIPYSEKEEAALELASTTMIVDDNGAVYQSYRMPQMRMFVYAKYYTNIDTNDWDTDEGHMLIYDYMKKHGCEDGRPTHDWMLCDFDEVEEIYYLIFHATATAEEKKTSISHRVTQMINSILGKENIEDTIAQGLGLTEQMIDVVGTLKREKEKKLTPQDKVKSVGNGLLNFAKK